MISLFETWMLGIALAMDCFSVSTSAAIAAKRFLRGPMLTMVLCFGLFQGGMTLVGYLGASTFSQFISKYAHWVASILLFYLGSKMIKESREDDDQPMTDRMFTAQRILILSVATSIDALAVGISFACLEGALDIFSILAPVLIIAFCSSAFTCCGLAIGLILGKRLSINAEMLGGIVLICIGLKILVEHFIL